MTDFAQTARELAGNHYYCEDGYYSCPKAEDGCDNEAMGDECSCRLDRSIAAILTALRDVDAAGLRRGYNASMEDLAAAEARGAALARGALLWMSAAEDFQVGGKARIGYEKIVLPLLAGEDAPADSEVRE